MGQAKVVETQFTTPTNTPNTAPVITNAIALTQTVAAIKTAANAKSGRVKVEIKNEDATNELFVGFANTVTASGATKGIEIAAGATKTLEIGDAVDLYGICSSTETATAQLIEY